MELVAKEYVPQMLNIMASFVNVPRRTLRIIQKQMDLEHVKKRQQLQQQTQKNDYTLF